ncbi:MAG TPA: alpha/beta fold hydrolase [Gemmatimonadaceae bacterium]|nr:alpha/beta fold hydrolase [Gemmatimonadaceae bacterium]
MNDPIEVSDNALAHADVGRGLPVVLLHAFPLNRTMWEPQIAALFGECRCIAPDLRGFGDSPKSGPFSMDQYADDVVTLLDAIQVEQAVVAGLSMGGYVALAMWRRHRERIRALVLADTRAGADTAEGRQKRDELIGVARAEGAAGVAKRQITGLIGKSTREKQPELVDRIQGMMTAESTEGIIGGLEAMKGRPDSTPMLAEIDVPTLIVVGDEDVVTPIKEARAMHEAIRGSRLEVVPGAGHLSNLERPAAFNAALSDFVGSLLYN